MLLNQILLIYKDKLTFLEKCLVWTFLIIIILTFVLFFYTQYRMYISVETIVEHKKEIQLITTKIGWLNEAIFSKKCTVFTLYLIHLTLCLSGFGYGTSLFIGVLPIKTTYFLSFASPLVSAKVVTFNYLFFKNTIFTLAIQDPETLDVIQRIVTNFLLK